MTIESTSATTCFAPKASSQCVIGQPYVSVILNFYDPRGHAKHIESWTRQQTLAHDRFEVIAVTTASRSSLADEIRSYLRPQDRLICLNTDQPFELYNPAVEAAKGDILFFSEDHCLAEPNCLEAALEFMNSTGHAGASVRWGHVNRNAVARMEQLTSERDFSTWFADGHWNKLRIRGFVLTRESYERVGGIDARYKNFSEAVLSAKLNDAGYTVGYIDAGGVVHINTDSFVELFDNVWKYSWHECQFCEEQDAEFCDRYFSGARQFVQSQSIDDKTRLWLQRAAGQLLRRELLRGFRPQLVALARVWAGLLASRCFGARGNWFATYAKLAAARAQFALWWFNERRRYRAFEEYWLRGAECGRADYAVRQRWNSTSELPVWSGNTLDVPSNRAFGCHGSETYAGKTFCWTHPVSLFEFDLPGADYSMTIGTAGFRKMSQKTPIGLYWNEHELANPTIDGEQLVAMIPVDAFSSDGSQRLTIVAPPMGWPFTRDTRPLGLPLMSIEFAEAQQSCLVSKQVKHARTDISKSDANRDVQPF